MSLLNKSAHCLVCRKVQILMEYPEGSGLTICRGCHHPLWLDSGNER